MPNYIEVSCAQNSFTEYTAEPSALLMNLRGYILNYPKACGSHYLGANCADPGIGNPPQTISNLQWISPFIIDYLDSPGGFSDPRMIAYIEGGNFLIYGVVSYTAGNSFGISRAFSYDGNAFNYQNINTDYPQFTFDSFENSCFIGGNIANPAVGIMLGISSENKLCLQCLYNSGVSDTINMFDYDVDHGYYSEASAFLGVGGFNWFGYTGYDGDFNEIIYIAKTVPSSYSDPIACDNLIIKPENLPFDLAYWGAINKGQYGDSFIYQSDDIDNNKSYLLVIKYDGSSYDLFSTDMVLDLTLNSDGSLSATQYGVGQMFAVTLSPIAQNQTKILTPISLPCTNPCIPMLREK